MGEGGDVRFVIGYWVFVIWYWRLEIASPLQTSGSQ